MKLPDFSKNDLELINVALKQAGKQYNNLFEPTTHLRPVSYTHLTLPTIYSV